MGQYLSEREALQSLNISSFKQIDESNFREFMRIFKDIDPEVARHALSIIPGFQKLVMRTLDEYKHNYDRTVDGIMKVHSDYTAMYSKTVEMLSSMSKNTDNPPEVKIAIINALLELESRYSDKGRECVRDLKEERKEQDNNVHKVRYLIEGGVVLVLAILLGTRGPRNKGGKA